MTVHAVFRPAGAYRGQTALRHAFLLVLGWLLCALALAATPQATLVLDASRTSYNYYRDSAFGVHPFLTNSGTVAIEGASVAVMVKNKASGAVVHSSTPTGPAPYCAGSVCNLAPGDKIGLATVVSLSTMPPGDYTLSAVLSAPGFPALAQSAYDIRVDSDGERVSTGAVTVGANPLSVGTPQVCDFTAINTSAYPTGAWPYRLSLINSATNMPVRTEEVMVSVPANGTSRWQRSYATASMAPGAYACTLDVARWDGGYKRLASAGFDLVARPAFSATLSVSADRALYNGAGDVVTFDLTARNTTTGAALDNAVAHLEVRSNGTLVYSQDTAAASIGAGATQAWRITQALANAAPGRYQVSATVGTSAAPNLASAQASYDVALPAAELSAVPNRTLYLNHEQAALLVTARNLSAVLALPGAFARVVVRGPNGQQLLVQDTPAALLDVSSSQAWTVAIPLANAVAGVHTVEAVLGATGVPEAARASATFTVALPSGTAAVSADKAAYGIQDTVSLQVSASNTTPGYTLPLASAHVEVRAPNGQLIYANDTDEADMAPGASIAALMYVPLQNVVPGRYTVTVRLGTAQLPAIATGSTGFDVVNYPERALSGSVSVGTNPLIVGTAQSCVNTVDNTSPFALAGQAVRSALVAGDGTVVASSDRNVTLEGGAQSTWNDTYATGSLAVGSYRCMLELSINGAWHTLASSSFDLVLPPVRIDATLSHGSRGRVLALLDVPGGEPFGPPGAPDAAAQKTYLEGVLGRHGWSHTVVHDAAQFHTALESGAYDTVLLASEAVKLALPTQTLVTQQVRAGIGLFDAGRHDERNHFIKEPLGIKFSGKLANGIGVNMLDDSLVPQHQAAFIYGDHKVRLLPQGAVPVGQFDNNASLPAVLRYPYGAGRSLTTAFDLLLEATAGGEDSLFENLLLAGLTEVHPTSTVAGRVTALRVQLHNQGIATPGRLLLTLPAGVTVLDAGSAVLAQPGQLSWEFTLGLEANAVLDVWVKLPLDPGQLRFEARIQSAESDGYADRAAVAFDVNVTAPVH